MTFSQYGKQKIMTKSHLIICAHFRIEKKSPLSFDFFPLKPYNKCDNYHQFHD